VAIRGRIIFNQNLGCSEHFGFPADLDEISNQLVAGVIISRRESQGLTIMGYGFFGVIVIRGDRAEKDVILGKLRNARLLGFRIRIGELP
jgi:hypothetical protein